MPEYATIIAIAHDSHLSLGAVTNYFRRKKPPRSTTIAAIEASLDRLHLRHLRADKNDTTGSVAPLTRR